MFAEETRSRSIASSDRRDLPNPSPRSAFRSMIICKPPGLLFLVRLLPAVERLGFDNRPRLFVILESAARELGQQLFANYHRSQPIGVTVIGLDRQPGKPGPHALV